MQIATTAEAHHMHTHNIAFYCKNRKPALVIVGAFYQYMLHDADVRAARTHHSHTPYLSLYCTNSKRRELVVPNAFFHFGNILPFIEVLSSAHQIHLFGFRRTRYNFVTAKTRNREPFLKCIFEL